MVRSIAAMADTPPLIVEENVEAFLDAHGLGCGPDRRDAHRRRRRLELHVPDRARRRPVRAPPPAAAAAAALRARHGARGRPAERDPRRRASHGLPTIVAVCEDESVLGVPFYVMRYLDGHVITSELPPGLETEAARHALGLDLVDTLVEIHAADVSRAELAAFARPGSYLERQVRRFTQLWEINKTRELPQVERGRRLARREPAGAAAADRRPRRLPPREHDGRARQIRLGSSPCSTGRWARSATRAPTSGTCSRPTPSRTAASARSARHR